MFTLTEVYNIVSAQRIGLEWKEEDQLGEEYQTFKSLKESKQKHFDKLIKNALKMCKEDFKNLPKTHRTKEDMEKREETENVIMHKLSTIFVDFVK